jgi:hypothetical protein
MLVPPEDLLPDAAHYRSRIRPLLRWALALLVATLICVSSSLSDDMTRHAGWLQLGAVLSGVGAGTLLIVAAIRFRRHESASLFPTDAIATHDPPVMWTAARDAARK